MQSLVQLEESLGEALSNLYNPVYEPDSSLWPLLHLEADASLDAVRLALIDAVEALRPAAGSPDTSDAARLYRILRCRFIEALTQRETAERLNLSERHLRREQQRALQSLFHKLWQQRSEPAAATEPDRTTEIRRELQMLMQSAPGELSDVGSVICSAVKISTASGVAAGLSLRCASSAPGMLSTIHRAVLREVIITAIGRMTQAVSRGGVSRAERDEAGITVGAERKGGNVVVTIAGGPAAAAEMPAYSLFIQEAIAAAGGTTSARRADDRVFFTITLPAADRRRVLVLEDNTDLVHLYRRYTTDTRYEIVHVSVDEDILHMAQTISPDVILMDILLPNVDGWELLSLFHEHPATRPIPVIICSVVRREELSLALGAALYLQKPVSLPVFIQALDQVLQETAPIA